MGIDDENRSEVPAGSDPAIHDAEQPAGVELDVISPKLRTFSAEFATKHGLSKLVEDEKAIDMRTGIVEQARTGADVRDAVTAYAEHLQNHFAQVENLKPPLFMAISQVVYNLLLVALKCERGMYAEAHEDLFGEEYNSVYTYVFNLIPLHPEVDFAGALERIQELSDRIKQASQKVG